MADILVTGLSARALSSSARRSGYAPLAADFFDDLDLADSAAASIRIDGSIAGGFEWEPLRATLDKLASGRDPTAIVYGAGFECDPDLLDRLAERWSIIGNPAAAIRKAKDPEHLSALCTRLGIAHPEIRVDGNCCAGWLRKRLGGSGGAHIATASNPRSDSYWQRHVEGDPVSALILGDGVSAMTIGLSTQWTDPAPGTRFRYGGAVRPANVSAEIAAELETAATRIVAALALVGMNSVDFLVAESGWHLIEVNPRPGATLDIFDSDTTPLFALHVASCRGELPEKPLVFSGAGASRIVYAQRDVEAVPAIDWPRWTSDRQPPGTMLRCGDPVCTVLAEAETATEARSLVATRGEEILALIGAA